VQADWRLEQRDGIDLVRCPTLLGVRGVAHAFSTRRADGGADFDLGPAELGPSVFAERRRRLCRTAGLGKAEPVVLRQVHGSRVVGVAVAAGLLPEADAVVALRQDRPPRTLAVRTADCVPILIADDRGRALAAVHAGWRGTAASVARRCVERLHESGIDPAELRAALGPAVGPCCYTVGEEVSRAVAEATGVAESRIARRIAPNQLRLDLRAANRRQLAAAGVDPRRIGSAPWCTACSPELFFSYRRQGHGAGRLMACIGWTGVP
jgi:YfiH family protein